MGTYDLPPPATSVANSTRTVPITTATTTTPLANVVLTTRFHEADGAINAIRRGTCRKLMEGLRHI